MKLLSMLEDRSGITFKPVEKTEIQYLTDIRSY